MRQYFPHSSIHARIIPFACLVISATLALTGVGCHRGARQETGATSLITTNGARMPIRLLVILDTSGSEDLRRRKQNVQFLLPAIRSAIGRAEMIFCVFDTEVREIGTPTFRNQGEFVDLMKQTYLNQPGGRGTFFAPVAQRIMAEAAKANQAHQRLVVVVATDGGFNDMNAIATNARQLQQIKVLDCLAMGPLTYERAVHGSYYDSVKRDLGCFEEQRLILVPEQAQLAGSKSRELEDRLR